MKQKQATFKCLPLFENLVQYKQYATICKIYNTVSKYAITDTDFNTGSKLQSISRIQFYVVLCLFFFILALYTSLQKIHKRWDVGDDSSHDEVICDELLCTMIYQTIKRL